VGDRRAAPGSQSSPGACVRPSGCRSSRWPRQALESNRMSCFPPSRHGPASKRQHVVDRGSGRCVSSVTFEASMPSSAAGSRPPRCVSRHQSGGRQWARRLRVSSWPWPTCGFPSWPEPTRERSRARRRRRTVPAVSRAPRLPGGTRRSAGPAWLPTTDWGSSQEGMHRWSHHPIAAPAEHSRGGLGRSRSPAARALSWVAVGSARRTRLGRPSSGRASSWFLGVQRPRGAGRAVRRLWKPVCGRLITGCGLGHGAGRALERREHHDGEVRRWPRWCRGHGGRWHGGHRARRRGGGR